MSLKMLDTARLEAAVFNTGPGIVEYARPVAGPGIVAVAPPPPIYAPPPVAGPGIVAVAPPPILYAPPPPVPIDDAAVFRSRFPSLGRQDAPPPVAGPGIVAVAPPPPIYAPPPVAGPGSPPIYAPPPVAGPGIVAVAPPPPIYAPPPVAGPGSPPIYAPPPVAGPGITGEPMSIFGDVLRAGATGIATAVGGPAAGMLVGAAVSGAGRRPQIAPNSGVAVPGFTPGGITRMLGAGAGSAIGSYLGGRGAALGAAVATTSGCGCGSSAGRDPCTHQKIGGAGARAPEASFFGGCCPPGRVLRRRPWARDICAKIPKMNPFNPRALARADKRVTSFAKRAAPMLKDLGFQVSRHRHPKLTAGKKHHAFGRKRRAA